MFNTKLLASIVMVLAVTLAQVGIVAAAPQTQDGTTTISGTITNIETQIDENGETIVVVTLEGYQPISLTAQEAADNGLFNLDTQELLVQEGDSVENLVVEPTDVIPAEEPTEPDVHPIAALLANFFFGEDPEMASMIDSFHTGDNEAEQVFGFGVIAQALWMSKNLTGTADADLAEQILVAKQTGEYGDILLPEGFAWPNDTAPTNWGQFKKALKTLNEDHDKQNLGVIVSDHADDSAEDAAAQQDHGNSKNDHKKPKKDKNPHKP